MTIEQLQQLLARAKDGRAMPDELSDALAFAIGEIDYLRRMAQAYKATAEARGAAVDVARAAQALSEHTQQSVDDEWQGPSPKPSSCWLVRDLDMTDLRAALSTWASS